MNYQRMLAICLTILCVTPGYGDVIMPWGDGTPSVDYVWYPASNELVILHGDGNDYKFWVHDGTSVPGTGVINSITVDANAAGDFTLTLKTPSGGAGALNWNEGDLRYAGGTSTVLGVKVAGNLGAQDERIRLERLDGSIEVENTTAILEVQEWSGVTPDSIHLVGHATSLHIDGDCAGDIACDSGITYMQILGDLSGSIDVDGWGNIYIEGDILDNDNNHVWVKTLGGVECNNMEIQDDLDRCLSFGPTADTTSGDIVINGTLMGIMRYRGCFNRRIIIDTMDAGATGDPIMEYGGIYLENGSSVMSRIYITDTFKQGWIYANNAKETSGYMYIGEMGQESPAQVARILTGHTPVMDPMQFSWNIYYCGNVWPSADDEPSIYCPGDYSGWIGFGECPNSSFTPGTAIQIDGNMMGASHIHGPNTPLACTIMVGGRHETRISHRHEWTSGDRIRTHRRKL